MTLLWIWFCASAVSLVSSRVTFHGHKVIQVQLETKEHVELIKSMDKMFHLNFWTPDSSSRLAPNMTTDFHIHAKHTDSVLQLLKKNTIKFEVLFHDLQAGIEAQLDSPRRKKSKHKYIKYNDWNAIADWMRAMSTKHSDLVSQMTIGKTYEGNPMYVLKVGQSSKAGPAIFMDCGIHAREWISPAFCQWFVRELVSGYAKDEGIKNMLTNLNFYILPVFNIDGYIYTWTTDRMWRKNRSPSSDEMCYGTDLNRNFNISWCDIGSSDDPCTEIYCGKCPGSEVETKNVANFILNNLSSIKAYISIHSYSQMLLYPYSYTFDPAPNSQELDEISEGAVSALSSLYKTKYVYGSSASTIYPTSGSSDDWAYAQGIRYSFTFELRDRGKHGFLLPESQIRATCKETTLAVQYIANYVLSHSS
ncbi:carboxypeptidase B-like [Hyla sarda]|uniref:carboxypeptidase B-like n=1 Tax=Hyla sarda TaxID=327740 RepID=UPI0024C35A47|nr:carboxypeptidase B-like [Hyla sarda]